MALIKIEMSMPPVDGMDIKFKAPCACTEITGLLVEYPEGSQEFTFRDSHGNNLAGIGNLFGEGAYVKVTVDTQKGYAYLQNADNNSFLNSGIFGTYTHDGENLTGFGENGKFKATTSGTISEINVNGAACSVKCGEESSMDLIAGCWYTFIIDGDIVNFNASGGSGGGGFKESAEYPGCLCREVDGVTEWLNPPMVVGTEYRTIERSKGNVVYAKAINFGTLPDRDKKTVSTGISYSKLVSCTGYARHSEDKQFEHFPILSTNAIIAQNYYENNSIIINTFGVGDGYKECVFYLKYIK